MKNNIEHIRKINNFSQTKLAKYLSVSQRTISNWETGRTDIDNLSLIKMSEIFNISIDQILTGKDHSLTKDEMDIINKYRSMSESQKKSIHEIVNSIKPYQE